MVALICDQVSVFFGYRQVRYRTDGWGLVYEVSGNPFFSGYKIGAINGLSELLLVYLHGVLNVRSGCDWKFLRPSSKIQNLLRFVLSLSVRSSCVCYTFHESRMVCT